MASQRYTGAQEHRSTGAHDHTSTGGIISESQVGNPYFFTGRRFDFNSGLYYYRARYYDPGLGRFMTHDPAGPVDGPNLYTYVNNNPVNLTDPMGLCWGKARYEQIEEYIRREHLRRTRDEIEKKIDSLPPGFNPAPRAPEPGVPIRG